MEQISLDPPDGIAECWNNGINSEMNGREGL